MSIWRTYEGKLDWVAVGFLGCGLPIVAGALLLVCGVFVVAIFGLYEYEYRCTDGVKEARYELFKSIPVGGWEPTDGDPAGGCP